MGITRQYFIISGTVQGVGYRFSALQKAAELGVTGWVKNLPSGQVEILAEADADTLTIFKSWVELGPAYANVTQVDVNSLNATNEFRTFTIR